MVVSRSSTRSTVSRTTNKVFKRVEVFYLNLLFSLGIMFSCLRKVCVEMAKKEKICYSGVGGQAVLEGVMMKNSEKYAVAVRKPDGEIDVKRKY